jgi:hypothetical protein
VNTDIMDITDVNAAAAPGGPGAAFITHTDAFGHAVTEVRSVHGRTTPLTSTGIPGSTSMATDLAGCAHVVYYDDDTSELRCATNASGQWAAGIIAGGFAGAVYSMIEVDRSGTPHVLVSEPPGIGVLTYYVREGGVWLDEEVAADPSLFFADMAVADDGTVHVVYPLVGGPEEGTYYTSRDPATGTWAPPSQIDPRGGFLCRLVLAQGELHTAVWFPLGPDVIAYARSPGWIFTDVVTGSGVFNWFDLVVDASGTAHVAYVDDADRAARYLAGYDDGTGWTTTVPIEDVATGADLFFPLLSIDDGHARAYGTDGVSLVMYERDADDVWTRFVLDADVQSGIPMIAGTGNDALGRDQLGYWHDDAGTWLFRHVVGPLGRRP